MIDSDDVFAAIRRGYTELENSSPTEIMGYFSGMDAESAVGHISNIKGILFEQEIVQALNEQGMEAALFEATNHPVSDIAIFDDDGDIIGELQLKATDSVDYISNTLELNPDVPIITTSEVAGGFDTDIVIDSSIDNAALHDAITATVFDDASLDSPGDAAGEILDDSASEGLADMVGDVISYVPLSPVGAIIKLGKLLFGFF